MKHTESADVFDKYLTEYTRTTSHLLQCPGTKWSSDNSLQNQQETMTHILEQMEATFHRVGISGLALVALTTMRCSTFGPRVTFVSEGAKRI